MRNLNLLLKNECLQSIFMNLIEDFIHMDFVDFEITRLLLLCSKNIIGKVNFRSSIKESAKTFRQNF